ncbi:MAG: hypothetical protein N2441_03300 [Rhodocyclaceae bacterium]|nr:hypothetical protein [Rhodocyclaceae bacterium]
MTAAVSELEEALRRTRARLDAEIATRKALERRLAEVLAAYARFVPHQLLELLGKDDILELPRSSPVEKKMTILFSDIRGFASMSEKMSPQQCFDFINAYLDHMEPVVLRHGGFIDKYIGDAIMALFPVRGDDALAAALDMLASLARFNAHLPAPAADKGPVRIGIGMNSGLLMLGAIGGEHRAEITVISDAVNLAARVEQLTKTWQTPILITQHTTNSLRNASAFSIRFIDRVRVRGKHLAQSIYEVFDADPPALKQGKLASLDRFEEGLAHYHFGSLEQAQRMFAACLEIAPEDAPARVYWQRCAQKSSFCDDEQQASERLVHWRPEYRLDFEPFDALHEMIFAQIVELAEALRMERAGVATTLMSRLEALVEEHFAAEERLMAAHAYPRSFTMEHRQQHEKFRAYLAALKTDLESGSIFPLRLAFRCQFLLLDWFVSHILVTDRHLERFLASATPASIG